MKQPSQVSQRRKRVLVLAYACSPYRGSEPGTGWNRAREIAKYCDTWVISEKNEFEADVERYNAENGPIDGLHFTFVPKSRFEERLSRVPGCYYVAYNLWHRRAYRAAVELDRRVGFDLIHQANMCGFREPGYLWQLDAPFVWGPIGGAQNFPWRLLPAAGWRGALREGLRGLVNALQLRCVPTIRKAARQAAVLMCANKETQDAFRNVHGVESELLVEIGANGVDPRREIGCDETLRILWSGTFTPNKALPLLIAALAGLPRSIEFELRVLGKGPLERQWRRLVREAGIEHACRWIGWISLDEVAGHYAWADVFAFTSLRDTAGTVVLEALSHGVPVICFDHQGAGSIVTPDCGIKVPVASAGEVIDGLERAIVRLHKDSELLSKLGQGAIERARHFSWTLQGQRLMKAYERVLGPIVFAESPEAGLEKVADIAVSSPPRAGCLKTLATASTESRWSQS